MKNHSLFSLLITLWVALLVGVMPMHAQDQPPGKLTGISPEIPFPDWFTVSFLEIMEDAEEAATEDKHVMLFFHMNGCPYCYQMAMENFIDAPYVDFIQQHFSVIELNWDGSREVVFNENVSLPEKELARHLGALATPTTIFLDADGSPIFRVDGYRDPETFKMIMDYVAGKHYQSVDFQAYRDSLDTVVTYDMPVYDDISEAAGIDLSVAADQPLMLLFESPYCRHCVTFHADTMAKARAENLLASFKIIRINTHSDAMMKDFDGQPISERSFTEQQNMATYEPGVLLYDDGDIRRRIDHKLFNFHFLEGLRWVANDLYKTEPAFFDYIDRITAERLAKGENINIAN